MKTKKNNQQTKVRELRKEEMVEISGGKTIIKVVVNGQIKWIYI